MEDFETKKEEDVFSSNYSDDISQMQDEAEDKYSTFAKVGFKFAIASFCTFFVPFSFLITSIIGAVLCKLGQKTTDPHLFTNAHGGFVMAIGTGVANFFITAFLIAMISAFKKYGF